MNDAEVYANLEFTCKRVHEVIRPIAQNSLVSKVLPSLAIGGLPDLDIGKRGVVEQSREHSQYKLSLPMITERV